MMKVKRVRFFARRRCFNATSRMVERREEWNEAVEALKLVMVN